MGLYTRTILYYISTISSNTTLFYRIRQWKVFFLHFFWMIHSQMCSQNNLHIRRQWNVLRLGCINSWSFKVLLFYLSSFSYCIHNEISLFQHWLMTWNWSTFHILTKHVLQVNIKKYSHTFLFYQIQNIQYNHRFVEPGMNVNINNNHD